MMLMSMLILSVCLVVASTIHQCQGFLVPARTSICHHQSIIIPNNGARETRDSDAILFAAKKRRRRKYDASDASAESDDSSIGDDELPDFDLDSADSEKVDTTNSMTSSSSISSDPNKVTSAMMGDPNMPVRSINELIADRSLERKFEFDEKGDDSIPDFTQLAQASSSFSSSSSVDANGIPMGKKKQSQADRRANAMRAKEEEREEESFLSKNIPFIKNEKGKVSPIKILEAGGK
jgi:hypothetical protein